MRRSSLLIAPALVLALAGPTLAASSRHARRDAPGAPAPAPAGKPVPATSNSAPAAGSLKRGLFKARNVGTGIAPTEAIGSDAPATRPRPRNMPLDWKDSVDDWGAHVIACSRAFDTYSADTDSYLGGHGAAARCLLGVTPADDGPILTARTGT